MQAGRSACGPSLSSAVNEDAGIWGFVRTWWGGTGDAARPTAPLAATGSMDADSAAGTAADTPLPLGKLCCQHAQRPCGSKQYRPVVLVSCGSFNPPTVMHLRMFDLAAEALRREGCDVLGGFMSPVNDAYRKPGLLPARHRLAMCKLACTATASTAVDAWEASQPQAQRSLRVLQRVEEALLAAFGSGGDAAKSEAAAHSSPAVPDRIQRTPFKPGEVAGSAPKGTALQDGKSWNSADDSSGVRPLMRRTGSFQSSIAELEQRHSSHEQLPAAQQQQQAAPPSERPRPRQQQPAPRAVLLCGADVLESFLKPGAWVPEQVEQILGHHGVVCIARGSTELSALLKQEGNVLSRHASRIRIVEDPATSGISSTTVRQLAADGMPLTYLAPDSVIAYIQQHRLYAGQAS